MENKSDWFDAYVNVPLDNRGVVNDGDLNLYSFSLTGQPKQASYLFIHVHVVGYETNYPRTRYSAEPFRLQFFHAFRKFRLRRSTIVQTAEFRKFVIRVVRSCVLSSSTFAAR